MVAITDHWHQVRQIRTGMAPLHAVFVAIQDNTGDHVRTISSNQLPVMSVCQFRAPRELLVAVGVVVGSNFEINTSRNDVLFLTYKCFKECLIIL
jgi:hypothetical protein